ncbi:MAG TPA: hypothetical protein PLR20_06420 [Syntrophales bacterium]|nr:hypothetical protein [Syntrophales bacterium]HPN24338.1 hypothetical protein [Syntrophales bacterium]HQM28968.1 hypothetical protein [Syntrophales bacterium]
MKKILMAMAVLAILFAASALAQAGDPYTPCANNPILNRDFEDGNFATSK